MPEKLSEISEARKILQEDVQKLQVRKENLETRVHKLTLDMEQDSKAQALDNQKVYNLRLIELDKIRSGLIERTTSLENMEQTYQERLGELEKRELELINLDTKWADLHKERMKIIELREEANQMIENAKIITAEAQASQDSFAIREQGISLREKQVKEKEELWNKKIGALEEKERVVEQKEKDADVILKHKEVANA